MTSPSAAQSVAVRFAVNVTPRPGILDPQGRAVEQSLPHLGVRDVSAVRVGRRVELTVEAGSEAEARSTVERLAGELLSNPLIEVYEIEVLGATSSARSAPTARTSESATGRRGSRATPGTSA